MASFMDSIRALMTGGEAERPVADATSGEALPAVDPLHLAACALLLEVAHADGQFAPAERAHLESVLVHHFSLGPEMGARLIALAESERARSIDVFQFTSQLKESYDLGQKMVLAEVIWGLVLADGRIAEQEQYLTRKIANLLDLEPGYLSAARNNAVARRGPRGL